ncbi:MAG: bifunctional methylenetetrahydrofolate dehydrogenase/methenyltetrahydrofolate cyclohydrolase FolD [Deltaproteobacteria bacterium]|nr:bifunctional methylenetetrahydrofolate dehydrogenase/methenyltetrahydrofolate cyclohydrolase FolD [Deltaproteobacteria bacterium]
MAAKLIKGGEVSKQIREEIAKEIADLKEKHGVTPGLATILVGDDPGSKVYVGQKEKACSNLGIYSERTDLPGDTSEAEVLGLVRKFNDDPKIHGILVQLPLPKQIDAERVIYAINPDKDVDCFHPVNVGKLMIGSGVFLPCTPHGIVELLRRSEIATDGKHVVVVGRSNIVGKPMVNLMLQPSPGGNATVTVCHTGTKDMAAYTRMADILIVAVGHPKTVTADMVKDGVVIVDVGVNRIGKTPEGKAILVGDVDFDSVQEKASAITPVPGGVGPMTITMLMKNTVEAAKQTIGG